MTQKTIALASAVGLLASIDPDAYAAGTVTTGWISAANWQDFMAVVAGLLYPIAETAGIRCKTERNLTW